MAHLQQQQTKITVKCIYTVKVMKVMIILVEWLLYLYFPDWNAALLC